MKRRVCLYWFFVSFFGRHQKTPFVTDKTWKTNVFGVVLEREKKKRKLLTSTANTHTMSMVMFDRSKVTKWTERFFTHCWLCFIVCSFCSFFLLLVPITFVLLMYTLLGIKIQSKPIAQVHLVHYSSAWQYGRACMESGSGRGRDNEKIKFMYVICGPETLNIALT